MKRHLMKIEAFALLAGLTLMGTGCSNYDDDIRDLNNRVDTIEATVGDLQSQIKAGSVITDVESNGSGVVIKLSDGKSYTINNGKDGVDGVDGLDAAVWTIGADGYWYKDDVKTSYRAIGQDGVNGKDGKDGAQGPQGEKGDKGDTGAQGPQGDKGDKGDTGAQGPQGDKGDKGDTGAQGPQGDKGDKGDTGAQGPKGDKGDKGENGTNGTNGKYYVPNANGFFDIYQDGEFVEATDISWKATGVTAVLNGNTLTLANVDGSETPVEIFLGEKLLSVAFVPDVISAETSYPTTSYPFYYINEYLDEEEYNWMGYFMPLEEGWDSSNEVSLTYRINPNDAYIGEDVSANFISRNVVTRAAGDRNGLLKITDWWVDPRQAGTIQVAALLNHSEGAENAHDLAALQLWSGSSVVTSDYIDVQGEAIYPRIVEKAPYLAKEDPEDYFCYKRYKSIEWGGETDEFLKEIVGTPEDVENYPANLEFKYDEPFDLMKHIGFVGFQSDENNTTVDLGFVEELGFHGVEYRFSLPKEYIAEKVTDKKTNQQECVELNGSVISVKDSWKEAAIGKKPVVRVDVFMPNNHNGEKELVHSSYIKLSVVRNMPEGPKRLFIESEDAIPYNYRDIKDKYMIAEMSWETISTQIYAEEGLSADNFWNFYGGDENKCDVILMAKDEWGEFTDRTELFNGQRIANGKMRNAGEDNGFYFVVNPNASEPNTTAVQVFIDDQVKTKLFWRDEAEYRLQIIFKADDNHEHRDYILEQDFILSEKCEWYEFSPSYRFTPENIDGTYAGASEYLLGSDDVLVVKGRREDGVWVMKTNVDQWFALKNNKTLYDYWDDDKTVRNVKNISFAWTYPYDESVTLTGSLESRDITVGLAEPMTDEYLVRQLTLTQTLDNDETCDRIYDIVFVNPFVGTAKESNTNIAGNANGDQTLDISTLPIVKDRPATEHEPVVIYEEKALQAAAEDPYGITNATVTYAWKNDQAYRQCLAEIGSARLKLDKNTGVITYVSEGGLSKDHNLTAIATIDFDGNYTVECEISVNLKK